MGSLMLEKFNPIKHLDHRCIDEKLDELLFMMRQSLYREETIMSLEDTLKALLTNQAADIVSLQTGLASATTQTTQISNNVDTLLAGLATGATLSQADIDLLQGQSNALDTLAATMNAHVDALGTVAAKSAGTVSTDAPVTIPAPPIAPPTIQGAPTAPEVPVIAAP